MYKYAGRADTAALLLERDALTDALSAHDASEVRFRLLRIQHLASLLGLLEVEAAARGLTRLLRQDGQAADAGTSGLESLSDAINAFHRALGNASSE